MISTTEAENVIGDDGDTDALILELRGILWNSKRTYDSIGAAANVGPNTISRWASGETKRPQLLKVLAVARVLGYDLRFVRTRNSRH
jgi:transcriptional regulator with XRE-family HTH domain